MNEKAEDILKRIVAQRDKVVDKKLIKILLSFIDERGLIDEFREYFQSSLGKVKKNV